jgi:hypothetical protein
MIRRGRAPFLAAMTDRRSFGLVELLRRWDPFRRTSGSRGDVPLSASLTMQCCYLETFPDDTRIKKQSYIVRERSRPDLPAGPQFRRGPIVMAGQEGRPTSPSEMPPTAPLIASWPPWTTSNQAPVIHTWGYKARQSRLFMIRTSKIAGLAAACLVMYG